MASQTGQIPNPNAYFFEEYGTLDGNTWVPLSTAFPFGTISGHSVAEIHYHPGESALAPMDSARKMAFLLRTVTLFESAPLPRLVANNIHHQRPAVTLLELLVVIAILAALVGITLAAVQRVRQTAARAECQNKLRQLALAAHSYHDSQHHLPTGWTSDADPKSLTYLGWTARLLPHLEREAQWRAVEAAFQTDPKRTESFGHPAHAELLGTPVTPFGCPADSRVLRSQISGGIVTAAFTSYLGNAGRNGFQNDGALFADSKVRFTEIRDGQSNTLLIGERPPSNDFRIGWWYRGWGASKDGIGEMILGVRERNFGADYNSCPPGPYKFVPGQPKNPCDVFHFWSLHPGGANFAFADGSVRFLSYSADSVMPALSTRPAGRPPPCRIEPGQSSRFSISTGLGFLIFLTNMRMPLAMIGAQMMKQHIKQAPGGR